MLSNFVFTSHSEDDTIFLGTWLGRALRQGCVVGLKGDLGAGKTCLVKGIAFGINGIPGEHVTSPTFTILQEYNGNIPIYHFDAYRLSGTDDLEAIGFYEYVYNDGISIIEWADKISTALPDECLIVDIEISGLNDRTFNFSASGLKHREILEKLKKYLNTDRNL